MKLVSLKLFLLMAFVREVALLFQLSVRQKNKKEKLGGFFKNLTKSADEVLLSGQKDVDDFFEQEKTFLVEYHNRIKDATIKSDKMTKTHKSRWYFTRGVNTVFNLFS